MRISGWSSDVCSSDLGHEHWSRKFTGRVCAAVPVQHPVTRRPAAIIGLALPVADDARLILALLKWAGTELRSALQFQEGDRHRALVDQYLRRRRPDRASLLLTSDLFVADPRPTSSDERRVGNGGVSTCK